MINSISFPQTAVIRSSQPQQPAPPAQEPAPQPPADGVDFSLLDCPTKVAQLPILEPAFQLAIAGGIAGAIFSAMGGGGIAPSITVGMGSLLNEQTMIGAEYKFDLNNQQNPITSEGVIATENGETPMAGSVSFNEQTQTVEWNSTIGNNAEKLTFSLNEDQNNPGINVSGTCGSIPVNLNFGLLDSIEQLQNNPTQAQGYTVSGTVGDMPYKVENRVTFDESSLPTEPPAVGQEFTFGTMTSRGSLGDLAISKDYTIGGSVESNTSVALYAFGEGTNAGVQQQVGAGILVENLPEGILR
jgi:hypothetical protein